MRCARLPRAVAVAALVVIGLAPWGIPASAADVSGPCSGSATSFDKDGTVVDNVRAPGPGGTEANPFRLDPTGSVAWQARTTAVMKTGTWTVSLGGAPVKSGAIDNPDGKTSTGGVQDIAALPGWARIPLQYMLLTDGKLQVDATATSPGVTCSGTVWITGIGSTTGSPAFWMGAGVMLLAFLLLLLLFTTTTATPTAAAAGAGEALTGSGVK